MAATLAFDVQQPTVGYIFLAIEKRGGNKVIRHHKKGSRESTSLVTRRCHGFKAALGKEWCMGLMSSLSFRLGGSDFSTGELGVSPCITPTAHGWGVLGLCMSAATLALVDQ